MDFDSIIYIIIAIVLAVVNAIAQNKKKKDAARARKVAQDQSNQAEMEGFEEIEEIDTEPAMAAPQEKRGNKLEDILKELDIPFLQEEPIPEPVAQSKTVQDEPKKATAKAEPMSLMEEFERIRLRQPESIEYSKPSVEASHEQFDFNFEENDIASTAIGDALTEEEQQKESADSWERIMGDFDGRKAMLYAEIINPKYS